VSEEVALREIIAQKDAQNRLLQAENERQSQEIKLLKEKIDLLIRRLFGSKSEKLDAAQLELLLKEDALGKADASAEKAEASPSVEVFPTPDHAGSSFGNPRAFAPNILRFHGLGPSDPKCQRRS